MRMTTAVHLAGGALALTLTSAAVGESFQFFVYDGKQYGPGQIDVAAVTPAEVPAPIRQANGDYSVPRAADGHYYIGGAINGFPVVFMVDTGAKFTSVATGTAANAGIRAGRSISVATAGGIERAGLSGGGRFRKRKLKHAKASKNLRHLKCIPPDCCHVMFMTYPLHVLDRMTG